MRCLFALLALCASAHPAAAQSAADSVGAISGGNPVYLERKTVKRAGNEVTATLRTVILKPAKAPGGDWYGSRTLVTVRCAENTAAVKENRYYGDARLTKVVSEKIVKMPGYGAPVPGSVTAVALRALCTKG